jgi:exodeoxyribonuclease VII large subunit
VEKSEKIHIYSVSELNNSIKNNLEVSFPNIWIEGEVSNFYCHNKRHLYFDLKDENSKIKVVMFFEARKKLEFEIEDGLHLIITGFVSVYEKRGEYQVIALGAKPVGRGSLLLAFEKLKARLEKKGYFDPAIKKDLPVLPKTIGMVTSTGGSVIRDMISVLEKRFNNYNLLVRNVNVQGTTSTEEICDAIDDLYEYGVDVIIIARGGGSLEDLWAFNTERVAEKVFGCSIPVISAVGHETDFTICDFVADVRAATPSVAAAIVTVDKNEVITSIKTMLAKAGDLVKNKIIYGKKELDNLINRKIFISPGTLFFNYWQEHDVLRKDLSGMVKLIVLNYKSKMDILLKDLHANSPVSVLQKGYALLVEKKEGRVIRSISQIDIGKDMDVTLNDGILVSKVLNKKKKILGLEV